MTSKRCSGASRATRRIDQIPEVLRPWLLPIDWNRERLWSLDLPRKRIALEELRWHMDLPWWRHDGAWYQVTPREFQAHPSAHPEHVERVASAELAYPLHVVHRRDRWLILDGIHRLTKSEMLGYHDVQVSTLRPMDIPRSPRAWHSPIEVLQWVMTAQRLGCRPEPKVMREGNHRARRAWS